jgi:hypothetical protein
MTKMKSAIAALIGAVALSAGPFAVNLAVAQEPPSAPAPSDTGAGASGTPADNGGMAKKSGSMSMKKKKKPSHHRKKAM